MKKVALIVIMLFTFGGAKAQYLDGTEWLGTNPPSPNLWFYFNNDTAYYSMTGGAPWTIMSLYHLSGDTIFILDLASSLCPDTGVYTYAFSGSNLIFTLVNDACASRRNTLLNYTWTYLATLSIGENQNENLIEVKRIGVHTYTFKNNSAEIAKSKVLDLSGRLIKEIILPPGESTITISEAGNGFYFLQTEVAGQQHSVRFQVY